MVALGGMKHRFWVVGDGTAYESSCTRDVLLIVVDMAEGSGLKFVQAGY